jgi:hypothetical protein
MGGPRRRGDIVIDQVLELRWQTQTAGLIVVLVLAGLVVMRSRRATGTFDKRFASLVMLAGLAWSAEAMYEIATGTFGLPQEAALVICGVFEAALWIVMRRAERTMDQFGWPGKAGRTVWFMAAGMGLVAAVNAHTVDKPDQWSAGPAVFRLAIPVVVTVLWWGGLVGEGAKPEGQESSWLWTPSKVLVRLGLKAPGKNDVAMVQRDWLADRMTKLEFNRRFGPEDKQGAAKLKLAKLALGADPEIISVVLARVSLADTFLSGTVSHAVLADVPPVVLAAASAVHQAPQDSAPVDVPAAQDTPEPVTDEDLIQLVLSYSMQTDADTGRPYAVRKIGQILDINKNKVVELRREGQRRLDNEVLELTPWPLDDQKANGHDVLNGASSS